MSYCRWSDDDFQCDIYAFEDETCFVVHVATNRRTPEESLPEWVSYCFSFDTAGECAAELERFRGCGYNVPQYAIDALREEAND